MTNKLLNNLYNLFKNANDEELKEIGKLSFEDFKEFEEEQFNIDGCFEDYEKYLKWVIEHFGDWN